MYTQFRYIASNNQQSIEVGDTENNTLVHTRKRTANNVMILFYEFFHFSGIFCESIKHLLLHANKKNVNFSIRTMAIGPESGEWNNAAQIMRNRYFSFLIVSC